jgi:hypothetical protein
MTQNATTTWEYALKNNARINQSLEHTKRPDELQILRELNVAMTIVSAARLLNPGASHIFLSQCLTTLGIDKESCQLGIVGTELNRFIEAISNALLSEAIFLSTPTLVQSMLLKRIVKGVIILSVVAGKLLALKKNKNKEISKIYNDLVLIMTANTGLLKQTLIEFLKVTGASDKAVTQASEGLYIISSLIMAEVSSADEKEFEETLDLFSKHFTTSLKNLQNFLSNSDSGNRINAFITEGYLSLENGRIDNFIYTLKGLLEHLSISKVKLEQDILEIEQTTANVYNTITSGLNDFAQTTEITA